MSIKDTTDISLHVEYSDYSIEYITFNNFTEARQYYLNNLSQFKILDILYLDKNNEYVTVKSDYIYS